MNSADTQIVGLLQQIQRGGIAGTANTFGSATGTFVEGQLRAFTDSSTATWGETITGGGSNHVLGYYNGTNWTVAAK